MPFGSLWLPVVVSAVAVFVLSSLAHMVLKHHRADHKRLPDEEAIAGAIRKAGVAPGVYTLPYCAEMSQMKDPAFQKKFTDGPVGHFTILRNGPPNMAKYLGLWFVFCVLVSFTAAYIARHTLLPGAADAARALQITGAVAFVGYGYGCFVDSIWKGAPWGNTFRGLLDALIYSVATGFVFKLLWPGI
jgi:hypothetical protein